MSRRSELLSPKERVLVELLLQHGPLYGLALVALSKGLVVRGTVYVTLSRMEEKGLVTGYPKPGDALVRLYEVMPWGRKVLAAARAAEAELSG